MGMFYSEEAVVAVLQSAHDSGEESLGPAKARSRAGVFRNPGLSPGNQPGFDALTSGTLAKLIAEGPIKRLCRGLYRMCQPFRLPT